MNKRILSPLLVAIIATISILPAFPILRVYGQTASLSVDPPILVGNPGDNFTVNVNVADVTNLVGYDVTVQYNPNALAATAVDFDMNTVFCLDAVGFPHIPCRPSLVFARTPQAVYDVTGSIRSAMSLVSGDMMTVDGSTGPMPVLIITFQVLIRESSPIHILTDEECACQALAATASPEIVGVPHDTFDGAFYAEPNIVLLFVYQNASAASASPRVIHLRSMAPMTTLKATLSLGASETLPGFAFVVFDVIDPNGNDIQAVSNQALMLPGDVVELTAPFSFSSVCADSCGSYHIFVTLWRGSVDFAMVPFQQAAGFFFRVNR